MNLSNRDLLDNKDAKFISPNKITSLNPNAAEFIPSSFRSPSGKTKTSEITRLHVPGPSAKSVLDRSESNISNKSDDEAQRYWQDQLPDDITPDFKSMGEGELHTPGQLSLATLSLHDGLKTSRFLTSGNGQLFGTGTEQDISAHDMGNLNLGEDVGYLGSTFSEDQPSNVFMSLASTEWDKRFVTSGQQFTSGREGHHYNDNSRAGLLNDSISDHTVLEDAAINPVEFMSSQFPGFAAESLADVYYANGCDLNSTIEILTQLELQVDSNFCQHINTKSSVVPSFNMLDFPALSATESNNGESMFNGDLPRASCTSPNIFRGTSDFASAVHKLASQDFAHQKYERCSSADGSVSSSSRSSQTLNSSYNGNSKLAYGEKVRSSALGRAAPVWVETGEAVGNMYSELREDARDFARLRNSCFEQARRAFLIGNGSLARELSRKEQWYNMQMKAAHGKARETIYRQRNPSVLDAQTQDPLIDLHGLHVNEAIQVLQLELSILKSNARSLGQRLQVMICVGTGHHTRGSRTPARLPVSVVQYLLEEGLNFTQPEPGLLRVVIY